MNLFLITRSFTYLYLFIFLKFLIWIFLQSFVFSDSFVYLKLLKLSPDWYLGANQSQCLCPFFWLLVLWQLPSFLVVSFRCITQFHLLSFPHTQNWLFFKEPWKIFRNQDLDTRNALCSAVSQIYIDSSSSDYLLHIFSFLDFIFIN